MKPARLALTNDLILNFGLYKDMNVYQSRKAAEEELNTFHSSDYLEFLKAYVGYIYISLYIESLTNPNIK